jgi:hypothetical protein
MIFLGEAVPTSLDHAVGPIRAERASATGIEG